MNSIAQICTNLNLSLNKKKTEAIVFKPKSSNTPLQCLQVMGESVQTSESVKLLGIIFDETMTFEKQVNSVCQQRYIQLKKLYAIRRFLNYDQRKMFATSFILFRLNYCNSLYLNISENLVEKIYRVHKSAARFVRGERKGVSVRQQLKKLHWLPVSARTKFKIGCIMFWVHRNAKSPDYISSLFALNNKSANEKRRTNFVLPKCKTETMKKSFAYQGGSLWNSLPDFVTASESYLSFRKNLGRFSSASRHDYIAATTLECKKEWLNQHQFNSILNHCWSCLLRTSEENLWDCWDPSSYRLLPNQSVMKIT